MIGIQVFFNKRNRVSFTQEGKCLTTNIVYKVTIKTRSETNMSSNVICEELWKQRFWNHEIYSMRRQYTNNIFSPYLLKVDRQKQKYSGNRIEEINKDISMQMYGLCLEARICIM